MIGVRSRLIHMRSMLRHYCATSVLLAATKRIKTSFNAIDYGRLSENMFHLENRTGVKSEPLNLLSNRTFVNRRRLRLSVRRNTTSNITAVYVNIKFLTFNEVNTHERIFWNFNKNATINRLLNFPLSLLTD